MGQDWGVQDSNLRRHKPSDLQSDPFDRSGNSPRVASGLDDFDRRTHDKIESTANSSQIRVRQTELAAGVEPATC